MSRKKQSKKKKVAQEKPEIHIQYEVNIESIEVLPTDLIKIFIELLAQELLEREENIVVIYEEEQ